MSKNPRDTFDALIKHLESTGAKVTVLELIPEWREEDPDGSDCAECEEAIYLTQHRLWLTASQFTQDCKTDVLLCGSCKEMLGNKS